MRFWKNIRIFPLTTRKVIPTTRTIALIHTSNSDSFGLNLINGKPDGEVSIYTSQLTTKMQMSSQPRLYVGVDCLPIARLRPTGIDWQQVLI
jgi:hypothetical protein